MCLLLLALPALALAGPGRAPANLLANPSFEKPAQESQERAAGWSFYNCGYTRSREKSYAPEISGPWSCKITGAGKEEEKGCGGANTAVTEGLPEHGSFAAFSSIYVESFTQGSIYGAYVTVGYTDRTEKIFSFTLTDAQVQANKGKWKTYRLAFTTDPQKKIRSLTFWCLAWMRGGAKFVGTVYFDDLELRPIEESEAAGAGQPFVLAARAEAPPQVDGAPDDACWKRSVLLPPFLLISGSDVPTQQTRAFLAFDDTHLYLFAECLESVLNPALQQMAAFKADQTAPDSAVYADDCVELFLQPDPRAEVYYHLVANSRGALYDARCAADGATDKAWNSGAAVKARVGERSWSVEMAIPLERLGVRAPAQGDRWRANLCRAERPSRENSCWSPTGGGFHTPARFGWIGFGPAPAAVGDIEVGARQKGWNRLTVAVANPGGEAQPVTVTAFVAAPGGVEVGKTAARVAPGKPEQVSVEYQAPGGDGGVCCQVFAGDRLLLSSPAYPMQVDTPFIARTSVFGQHYTQPITTFAVAQGEVLAVPLVLPAGMEQEQFQNAQVILEVPALLRLVDPLAAPRRCPTPLRVAEEEIRREGKPYRRLTLEFGAGSITFPEARGRRELVLNPLLFRAEAVGGGPAAHPIAYEIRMNGQKKASGEVVLHLLPPFVRRSPRDLVVCNWPCGGTYMNAFFGRLSEPEQREICASWERSGINTYNFASGLRAYYRERGLRTAAGLPGTVDDLCHNIPEIAAYLAKHPEFRAARLDGKVLDRVVSPAHLLDPACPARALIREFVGKWAREHPVLSWDYEVPVTRPESIDFSAANLAAFRQFARLPDAVALTPESVLRDHREQWVDFRCRQNAGIVQLLQEGIKAANPRCVFFVYSGYQGAHTRETYGIDWGYVAPHIDQAWCGYGRPVEAVKDTLKVLGGKALVGGELAWLGDGHPYNLDESENNLFRRLTDSAGGVMVYYDWFVDGRFFQALSRTAAVAADFEGFFRKGRRDDALASVLAGGSGNAAVYALGEERLLFLFNPTASAQAFRVEMKDLPAGMATVEYWTRARVPLAPVLETTVPAHGVAVFHIRKGEAPAPAAPRALSPAKERVSDRCPVLVWGHDGGADSLYTVELSTDRSFAPAATKRIDGLPRPVCVLSDPLEENATYYWRVRAADAPTGKPGAFSAPAQFTLGPLGVQVGPAVFSPNGDGAYDAVSIRAELRSAAPWNVVVVDRAGKEVRRLSGTGSRVAASWDGKDGAGKPAAEGAYQVRLAVRGKPLAAERVELNPRFGMPNGQLERWCTWRPEALEGGTADRDYHIYAPGLPYALMLAGTTPEARAYWANYRTGTEIPIQVGKTYTYTGLVKTDLAAGAEARISLHFFTKDDRWAPIPGLAAEWEGVTATAQGKREWTRLTVSCKAPENAAKAVLFFHVKGRGKAWMGSAEFGEGK